MRKVWRDVLIFSAVAVFIPFVIYLLIRLTPRPPIGEMESAREILSSAETNKADIYSKKLFTEAKVAYDSALINWQRENKRFIYFRHYDRVKMFAVLASKKANQAMENSISSSSNLKIKIKQKIQFLDNLVVQIDALFTTYPLASEVRDRISKGKLLLDEAEIVYDKGQYLQANRKITDAEYLLTESYENASANLKNYFRSYSVWKRWVDKTITESRKNRDYSIIIDKFSRKCFVYLSGSKKFEFEAELGKNWVGDKRVKGDMATPEGMYKIAQKFDGGKTKYYKALLLDYPNDEDKQKFRSEIEHGTLPRTAKIGGLIEIHGNGGKGIDWTEGCIALTDMEMDIVFRIVRVGTPVTIIGSMAELKDVVDK
jgi:L,D-peptidoglycan transpeptidase YkuD (ErfK/YbiS/YcfS/YnhG family)